MFVFLSKFLPLLVYPLGLACITLLVSLVIGGDRRWKKWLIAFALAILFLSSNRWVAFSLTRALESQYLPPAELTRAEMIVVLGGGTESNELPRSGVEINGAGDRVIHAVRLYRQNVSEKILLSGGNIDWLSTRANTPAQEMRELMVFMGVPETALIMQERSQNTAEDALYSSEILNSLDIDTIILVTSAQHMPRSAALFAAQGITVIPSPADYSITDAEWHELWRPNFPSQLIHLLPNAGYLSMTTTSLKEFLGLFVYRLRGWL
ncbi:MAG: YdcF family protein [Bellilinea sp.]|jgi:uncharacterized SAM-binding protein YcdF (DUF218 family)